MCNFFSNHSPDIIIGLVGGLSAGAGIWVIDRLRELYLFSRDEKRIMTFYEETQKEEWNFFTTHRIASEVNLTIERVNYVCSYSKKVRRNQREKEVWIWIPTGK